MQKILKLVTAFLLFASVQSTAQRVDIDKAKFVIKYTMASFGMGAASAAAVPAEQIEASTPWLAAADGKLSLLQSSLSHLNLTVTAADENGYTLLQAAASYGQLPVMEWILNQVRQFPEQQQQVAAINAVDKDGDSALHYAGTVEAAKLLVDVGINATLKNAQGKTALEAKVEEMTSMMEEDEEDSDSEDAENLRKQIQYLENPMSAF